MAKGLPDLEATIARLEAGAEDARAATRAAHEATKALHGARREALEVLAAIQDAAAVHVDELIRDTVTESLKAYGSEVLEASRRSQRSVADNVQRAANVAMFGNAQGRGPSIFDEMRESLDWYRQQLELLVGTPGAPRPIRDDLPSIR